MDQHLDYRIAVTLSPVSPVTSVSSSSYPSYLCKDVTQNLIMDDSRVVAPDIINQCSVLITWIGL